LAGDKNLCDNKRIVILNDVTLNGFDCILFFLFPLVVQKRKMGEVGN